MLNAQAQPPHVERREPVERGGRERHAVVGANRPGQPILAEEAIEDGPHARALRREQAVAREQVAGVLVGDREWVAVDPIAGAELAFEVGRPQVVGGAGDRRDDARVMHGAAPPSLLHEAVSRQEVAGGADRRPRDRRVPGLEPLQEFLRSPVGVLSPCRQQELRHRLPNRVRTVMGRSLRSCSAGRPPAS